jgi:hypothetical protein
MPLSRGDGVMHLAFAWKLHASGIQPQPQPQSIPGQQGYKVRFWNRRRHLKSRLESVVQLVHSSYEMQGLWSGGLT